MYVNLAPHDWESVMHEGQTSEEENKISKIVLLEHPCIAHVAKSVALL